MRKNYVLDTNVLLHDPQAMFRFEDNDVLIPIFVIEEADGFKREMSERGAAARAVCRHLDRLREEGASLAAGVLLDGGGTLRVAVPRASLDLRARDSRSQDAAILQLALDLKQADQDKPTVFVTMDTNLRIRADALGLHAETYDSGRVVSDGGYGGSAELTVDGSIIDALHQPGAAVEIPGAPDLHANQCLLLRDAAAPNHTALGRVDPKDGKVKPLRVPREGVWGIRPRNKEQSFALDLLLDDEVKLVTLVGRAGTGKTLLAVAAGLRRTVDDGVYARMLVSRPVFPLGKDIGYLPGAIEDKLNPWMKPIYDNLELIFNVGPAAGGSNRSRPSRGYQDLFERGLLDIEPLTYIRGRSLPNQFLVVDEAQNLTPHEVKTVITRCGDNTKIVLTGDPEQIDNPYVDAESNGLVCVAERFKGNALAGHMRLVRGERSQLAELAAGLL
ncbi:MAG: PhoH family protein [Myxococcota bacterium]|nr:PhoH family protein [Myxococcota bacterium]